MAKLVQIFGTPHHPFTFLRLPEAPKRRWDDMRQKLEQARPDALLVVGSDHLNQFFMDNMPPFVVGKSPIAEGPFPYERDDWRLPPYKVPVDVDLAKAIICSGFGHDIDFAFSDEFRLDHAFIVPLAKLRPEADIPIVPVFANMIAPPLPPPQRFYKVGQTLARIVEGIDSAARVCVVLSGHLSVEVGGP